MNKKTQILTSIKYEQIDKPFTAEELESNRANYNATAVMRNSSKTLGRTAEAISKEYTSLGKVFDAISEISSEISGIDEEDMNDIGTKIDELFWLLKNMSTYLSERADFINQHTEDLFDLN